MKPADEFDHLTAIAEAGHPGPDHDDPLCGSTGPGGQCQRARGHTDTEVFPRHGNDHWSWDSDHFVHWPVGWSAENDVYLNCGHTHAAPGTESPKETDRG